MYFKETDARGEGDDLEGQENWEKFNLHFLA